MAFDFSYVPKEQFAEAARRFGLSADELRSRLSKIDPRELHGQIAKVSVADAEEGCKDIDFDIKIFRVKGKVCFTPGSDWKLSIDLTLYVAGIEVSHVKYTFSAANTSVCYKWDLLLVSLHVCFGVRSSGGHVCLFTSGKACAFGKCSSWDETIVCFN